MSAATAIIRAVVTNSGRLFVCIIGSKVNVNAVISDRYGYTPKEGRNCQTLFGLDKQLNFGQKQKFVIKVDKAE